MLKNAALSMLLCFMAMGFNVVANDEAGSKQLQPGTQKVTTSAATTNVERGNVNRNRDFLTGLPAASGAMHANSSAAHGIVMPHGASFSRHGRTGQWL
jgi:hypothetical protein